MFRYRIVVSFLAALLCLASSGSACGATAFSLNDVAWMEGHWIMERDGGRAEEIWMAPLDGSMVGSFRWVVAGQMHVLEFLVIEQQDAAVTFRFKHFHKDYRSWEESPNTYKLIRVAGRTATFENVDWNGRVPQFFVYSSPSPDRLMFTGESPGESEPMKLEYVRAK
jgi:hypothetical protein